MGGGGADHTLTLSYQVQSMYFTQSLPTYSMYLPCSYKPPEIISEDLNIYVFPCQSHVGRKARVYAHDPVRGRGNKAVYTPAHAKYSHAMLRHA
jgi:hypothetical protein